MDVFPKFIIETDNELGDCLIIAKCTYHSELVTNKEKVKGGGWWRRDTDTNTFILHGDSHDFGKATVQDIEKCINSGNVFSNASCTFPIADKHNFSYDTGSEIIELNGMTNVSWDGNIILSELLKKTINGLLLFLKNDL